MENKTQITASESELNLLFREVLDAVRDDVIESDENAQIYLDAIKNDPGGKELYGSLYNDALKIKGQAQDRRLKFLGMFKERVSKKEEMSLKTKEKTGSEFSINHGELNEIVAKLKEQTTETSKPYITPNEVKIDMNESDEEGRDEDEYEIDLEEED